VARTVNEHEYAMKRNEILDVAQRLVYTKGYELMAIQDILDELKISKGAFYHYFDSKPALLEALIERIGQEALQLFIPIVQDPQLNALEKLQRYIDTGVRWKTARKAMLIELMRIWYTDHNAIVRQKMMAILSKYSLPLLTTIFHQGIREGVLDIPFPDQIGGIFLSLMQGIGDAFAELLLASELRGDELQRAERLVAAYAVVMERVLGAPTGSLQLMDAESLKEWFIAPHDEQAVEVTAEQGAEGSDRAMDLSLIAPVR
jgi:AcrR family transcriptional regulator